MNTMRRAIFHLHDPFFGVELEGRQIEMYGWYYDHPIFQQIISQLKPTKIIEVGSLYGASAIHMAKLTKELGLHAEILCIDTFLGAPEYWEEATMPQLKLRCGFPRFYEQFMVNVIMSGQQDVITPFPLVSTLAAQVLRSRNISVDLIYVDAAHTYREALADIQAFWPLVRPGGVMFGDDFDINWPGVIRAVHEWTEEEKLTLGRASAMASTPRGSLPNTKWYVQKPA
jgi:SAM-dependent methyltransferase